MVKDGLTRENQKLISEKAKHKKNGCYKFRGVYYLVENANVRYYAFHGEVIENALSSNVIIGRYEHGQDEYEILKNIKK